MRFYSRKSWVFAAMFPVLGTLAVVSFINKGYAMCVLITICISYFGWMWFDTWYQINGDELFYKSALLKGAIKIDAITEVVKNKTISSGIKPALSTKGIAIKYNRWDEIYVSPVDVDLFIIALKNANADINVIA